MSKPSRSVTLIRKMPQRPRLPIDDQINLIVKNAMKRGVKQGWKITKKEKDEKKLPNGWKFRIKLQFSKIKGRINDKAAVENQWDRMQKVIEKTGLSKFNKYPWQIIDETTDIVQVTENINIDNSQQFILTPEEESIGDIQEIPPGVHNVCIPDRVLTIEELKGKFPTDLMTGTDEYIENHQSFKGIFGRGAQIRSILSAIWSFLETNGERANHTLLFGPPGCAKTQILLRLVDIFGPGAVLKLDSTSTTKAGLEKLIFKDLKYVPLLFICEEIEKAEEQALRIWLGAMDDRHEFRKVNARMQQVRKVNFLALATANDKDKFDSMMGGRIGQPGALSSRYIHQHECPRPTPDQMRLILKRDIIKFGGNLAWIEPCMVLAEQLKTNDPRKILGFLDGRDRLLDESYQKDQLVIAKLA